MAALVGWALCLLLVAARPARAQGNDCVPGAVADSLPARLEHAPYVEVVGGAPNALFAYARTPGCRARLDVWAAGPPPQRLGQVDGDWGEPQFANGYLYARAPLTHTISVFEAQYTVRQTLVGQFVAPPGPFAVRPGALYLAPAGGGLQVYSLANPAAPALRATLPLSSTHVLSIHENTLLALGSGALHAAAIAPFGELSAVATATFTATLNAPYELLAAGGYAYALGADGEGNPVCHTVRLAPPVARVGVCPFVAGKTLILGGFGYVNPNRGASEYLDYQRVSLANPAAPQVVGTTPLRWARAVAFDGFAYASTFDFRLLRLEQGVNGVLAAAPLGWDAQSLAVDGPHRLLHEGVLYVDRGLVGGSRTVRRVVFDSAIPKALEPDFASPHLGAGPWQVGARRLYAFTGAGLTVFDSATATELGRLPLPPGESPQTFVVGEDGFAWLVTASNLYLTIDARRPTTPTIAGALGLPGKTTHLARTGETLYAFDEASLRIFSPVGRTAVPPPKVIPIEPGVREVTAVPGALLVRRSDTLELLNVADPRVPHPVAADWGAGAIVRLLPAVGNRVAIIARLPAAQGVSRTEVRLFAFAGATARRLATLNAGGATDAQFDGTRLVLPNLVVWEIGGVTRDLLAAAPGAPITLAPGITATLPISAPTGCLEVQADERSSVWIDGGVLGAPDSAPSARTPTFRLALRDCASGNVAALTPITIEVEAGRWSDGTIGLDNGQAWVEPVTLQRVAERWRFTLLPGQAWAVVGPPPDPIYLPLVLRPR